MVWRRFALRLRRPRPISPGSRSPWIRLETEAHMPRTVKLQSRAAGPRESRVLVSVTPQQAGWRYVRFAVRQIGAEGSWRGGHADGGGTPRGAPGWGPAGGGRRGGGGGATPD